MKRTLSILLLIFLLKATMLIHCYSEAQVPLPLTDLKLLDSYESSTQLEMLHEQEVRLTGMLEAIMFMNDKLAHLVSGEPEALTVVDRDNLMALMAHHPDRLSQGAFIFGDALYGEYKLFRSGSLSKPSASAQGSDLTAFYRAAAVDFEKFYKQLESKPERMLRLTLLVQDKLMEKAMEKAVADRDAYFQEILALRMPGNKAALKQVSYQLLESRVRLDLLEQLFSEKRRVIEKQLQECLVKVYSNSGGVLSFSYRPLSEPQETKSTQVYIPAGQRAAVLNLGILMLGEGELHFQSRSGPAMPVLWEGLLGSIRPDHAGGLCLDLDAAGQATSIAALNAPNGIRLQEEDNRDSKAATGIKQEAIPQDKVQAAAMLVAQLTRHAFYEDAGKNGLKNTFTDSFEKDLPQWRHSLLQLMKTFGSEQKAGSSGMTEFYQHIREYGELDGNTKRQLREQVLQYKDHQEACLWILDRLYALK